MKQRLHISGFLYLLLLSFAAKAETPHFVPVKGSTALSYSTFFSLYQDEQGVIWMNTNNGLIRYNGNRFEQTGDLLKMKPLCGDRNGHLYMQTNLALIEYDIRTKNLSKIPIPPQVDLQTVCFNIGTRGLWVGSGHKLYLCRDHTWEEYAVIGDSSRIVMTSVLETGDGNVLAGTRSSGLYRIGTDGGIVRIAAAESEVHTIYEDVRGNVWAGTWNDGAYRIAQDGAVEQISTRGGDGRRLSGDFVRAFCEDRDNNLWIGTMNGLHILDARTGRITRCELPLDASRQSVWCILRDNRNGMWVGTYYGGIYYCPPDAGMFRRLPLPPNETGESYMINDITEDKRNDLWICSDGLGLIQVRDDDRSSRIIANPYSNKLKTIHYDPQDDALWTGTHLGGLNRYEIASGRWTHYTIRDHGNTAVKQVVSDIAPWEDKLFLAMYDRVRLFDPATGQTHRPAGLTVDSPTYSLTPDDQGNLWITAQRLYRYDVARDSLSPYLIREPANRLKEFSNTFQDKQGWMWAATAGDGFFLLDGRDEGFDSHTIGLENNFVSSIHQMDDGKMIVATNNGVSLFDMETNSCVNYNFSNGFPLTSMRDGCIFRHRNGEFLLGGVDGIAILEPNVRSVNHTLPALRIDNLKINNRDAVPGDGILEQIVSFTRKIKLSHDRNTISIEVAGDDYARESSFVYEYCLTGIDREGTRFDPETPVTYNNLPPGNYRFSAWVWSQFTGEVSDPVTLAIRIAPPWFSAWYAWSFYVLAVLGVFLWMVYFFWQKMRFRSALEQQQMTSRFKSRFFTHISHEFRTPLTLIIGQLEVLLQNPKIPAAIRKSIANVYRHSMTMQELISQLLDFEKQNQGYLSLRVRERDLVDSLREIHAVFEPHALAQGIGFGLHAETEHIPLWFDELQLQKVFYNLLSNAFKFTAKGGRVTLRIACEAEYAVVSVEDTGIGIRRESLERIFEDFYQDTGGQTLSHRGTGIGLALAQRIVESHHGTISVTSEPGHGSCFTVRLPLGAAWFADDPKVAAAGASEPASTQTPPGADDEFLRKTILAHRERLGTKPVLLMVEDDADVRALLYAIFEPMYEVLQAADGDSGYRIACESQPDIVVSDVMMPGMDGRQLCTSLKRNFQTCHIPVVLLTARGSDEQNIEGLRCGADDYVTKPFNVKLLVTRCNNLLYNRKTLREKFLSQEVAVPGTVATNEQDMTFIEKVVGVVDARIESGTDVSVPELCREMAMSKTMFTLKIKGITGQSPGEFIQSVRLKKAANLIRNHPEKSISEIAYELGFSSPKYFRTCFKQQFSVSPSQMRGESDA